MSEKIEEGERWKATALATQSEWAKERAAKAIADFNEHIAMLNDKYKIRPGVDEINNDGKITRGAADEVK